MLAAAGLAMASPGWAQVVKPWAPAGADTIVTLAAQANVRFKRQLSDSINAETVAPYELAGQAARRLLRQLGRQGTLQAPAIEATLDSLGLDTDVVNDPLIPSIVLVLVRNPNRPSAQAIGYLFWYRGIDLRMQGATFPPCVRPRIRSWWSGRAEYPYEVGVVFERRGERPELAFRLFRMSPDGFLWNLVQYEGHGPALGRTVDATFSDVNGDGLPELVGYTRVQSDSFVVFQGGAPSLVNELLYTERREGFVLHDERVVPGPAETFRLFAMLLSDRKREAAQRLLARPEKVDEALANWGAPRVPGRWTVEYGEPDEAWPEWLELRYAGRQAPTRWIFHFVIRDGRWIIRDWLPVAKVPTAGGVRIGAPPDSSATRKMR